MFSKKKWTTTHIHFEISAMNYTKCYVTWLKNVNNAAVQVTVFICIFHWSCHVDIGLLYASSSGWKSTDLMNETVQQLARIQSSYAHIANTVSVNFKELHSAQYSFVAWCKISGWFLASQSFVCHVGQESTWVGRESTWITKHTSIKSQNSVTLPFSLV